MSDTLVVEKLPSYAGPEEWLPAKDGDAGLDLYAAGYVQILPGDWALVPCGIKIALPTGTEGQVRPRSGNALKKGLVVLNSPGTIDEGYRGEVMVMVHNINPVLTTEDLLELMSKQVNIPTPMAGVRPIAANITSHDLSALTWSRIRNHTISIKPGDKVAQLVITRYERPPVEYTSVDATARGADGFGSSDVVEAAKTEVDSEATAS